MGKFLLWVLILVIVVNTLGSSGCLEEERIALLHVKSHIMNNTIYGHSLASWIDDKRSDCCKWPKVSCSNITRRVTGLDLYFIRDERDGNWFINATVFLPFKHLNSLLLFGNNLAGVVENGGFDKLSKLHNLKELDLGFNNLNRSILSSLSQLSSLTHLSLDGNPLDSPPNNSGQTRLSGLSNLEILSMRYTKMEDNNVLSALNLKDFISLKELDISDNKFKSLGPINGELKKLESLILNNNRFNVSIFQWFKMLPSLKILDLSENDIHGRLHIQDINAALSNLEELSLSYNYIEGFEASASLSDRRRLMKLEKLYLDNNKLNSTIFNSLKWFPSLKFVDLRENDFHGPVHIQDINALSSLEFLDLSDNSFEDFEISTKLSGVSSGINLQLYLNNITCNNMTKLLQSLATLPSIKSLVLAENNITSIEAIHALGNLSNVEELILGTDEFLGNYSYLHKDFLQSIGPMNSLKILSLKGAHLGGTLPNKGWCELRNLKELRLSENQLEGMLPSCMKNLTSLRFVDLSVNKLMGNIGSSPFSTLMSLEYLSISNNSFEVPTSFKSFANHSKLRFIIADKNKAIVENERQSVVPKFQLVALSMSECNDLWKLPGFLQFQHDLEVLLISRNNLLSGDFPNWLLQNNTKLRVVIMNSNSFTRTFKLSSGPNHDMWIIDVSKNMLSGEIPNNLSSTFPNVGALNLSYNLFEGQIPSHLRNFKHLGDLDLSNNSLTGKIPKEVLIGLSSLYSLKLSNNKLEGEMEQEFAYLSSLSFLYLDGNNFSGTILDSISNISLYILDISDNNFSGEIPRWMGHMARLEHLSLSKNHLKGFIPVEFCDLTSLISLDLSENNLTGSIPSCLNPSSIKYVGLSQNHLGGQLTNAFFNNTGLVIFDLSYNDFVGKIPEWIGSISELSILSLKGNRFEGEIPMQVCQLMRLSILDLSNNRLIGRIPHCLDKLSLAATNEKSEVDYGNSGFGIELSTTHHVSFILTDDLGTDYTTYVMHPELKFTTKGNLYYYKGLPLEYMCGIDLSDNRLYGEIPFELGNLNQMHVLNLSHNNLSGPIPETFSMLHNIESIDLSYNKLSGKIPNTLLKLTLLAVFRVAYNNLTGAVPELKAQFSTFNESDYEGNPYLCGPPLLVKCSRLESPLPPDSSGDDSEESDGMDMEVFYISSSVSYVVTLLTIVLVFCINPHWRNKWFQLIEVIVYKCLGKASRPVI